MIKQNMGKDGIFVEVDCNATGWMMKLFAPDDRDRESIALDTHHIVLEVLDDA